MKNSIQSIIGQYGLQPHPEGGYYREVFRSPRTVRPSDGQPERNALTAIYFLLPAGQHSRWHRVLSDEAWCHLDGDPLKLVQFTPGQPVPTEIVLGHGAATSAAAVPLHVVTAGAWQAARPCGEYALVGCCVGPGFDFSDFCLAVNVPDIARQIERMGNEYAMML